MHSLLIVIGNGYLDEMMEPYWQNLEVEEYSCGEVSDFDKKRVLEYYNRERTLANEPLYASFDECYGENGEDWNGNLYRKDENGVWQRFSTCNPDMRWDWYEVGGRFAGCLQLKPGVEPIAPVHFSYGWDEEEKRKVLESVPKRADVAFLRDIINVDDLTAISVLKDGIWEDLDDYEGSPVKPYLEGLPEDTLITVVDYHM